jgi:hypothetical protein
MVVVLVKITRYSAVQHCIGKRYWGGYSTKIAQAVKGLAHNSVHLVASTAT